MHLDMKLPMTHVFSCHGLSVYQTTDATGEPVALFSILPPLRASVSPQDALALADALAETFKGFR